MPAFSPSVSQGELSAESTRLVVLCATGEGQARTGSVSNLPLKKQGSK